MKNYTAKNDFQNARIKNRQNGRRSAEQRRIKITLSPVQSLQYRASRAFIRILLLFRYEQRRCSPVSINALTGNPLTLQLTYNITTDPNVSGLYSIAASMFASMFFCLISSAINLCASVSNGSAFIILSLCASRSSLSFICSLSTVVNLSANRQFPLHKMNSQIYRYTYFCKIYPDFQKVRH